uniref:(northern house mosquito) hypothetical protein n=1 Tax=Culex pipiens TaxID=7175 RepID=A0A8D8C8V7_CULPI
MFNSPYLSKNCLKYLNKIESLGPIQPNELGLNNYFFYNFDSTVVPENGIHFLHHNSHAQSHSSQIRPEHRYDGPTRMQLAHNIVIPRKLLKPRALTLSVTLSHTYPVSVRAKRK